jgi:excisionase family DNA binding protein
MDQLFTTHDAAQILQVHPFTVAKWIDRGMIKAWRTAGGHRRVQAEDLRRYLVDNHLPVPPELLSAEMRLRLLVVDDEPIALRAIERSFKPHAHEVNLTCTSSGVEALLLLGEQKPDAMLIDLNMPDLDGYEVCRRVRSHASLSSVTLIAMTALHRPEIVAQALKAGAVACLAKPFAVEQVMAFAKGARVRPPSQRGKRPRGRATVSP